MYTRVSCHESGVVMSIIECMLTKSKYHTDLWTQHVRSNCKVNNF